MDAALPSWHLAPFWAAVALLALVLMLAVIVWPLRGRIANSRVLRQFAAVRRVSSDPSIVRWPHLLPSVFAGPYCPIHARNRLCLPRSLRVPRTHRLTRTRARARAHHHNNNTHARTHAHTPSLSPSLSADLPPPPPAPPARDPPPSLARAHTSSPG